MYCFTSYKFKVLNQFPHKFILTGVSPAAMFAVRPMVRNQQQRNAPPNKLHQAIEESYEEYKNLEKERKKVNYNKKINNDEPLLVIEIVSYCSLFLIIG